MSAWPNGAHRVLNTKNPHKCVIATVIALIRMINIMKLCFLLGFGSKAFFLKGIRNVLLYAAAGRTKAGSGLGLTFLAFSFTEQGPLVPHDLRELFLDQIKPVRNAFTAMSITCFYFPKAIAAQ
jgi:hypothetical protein